MWSRRGGTWAVAQGAQRVPQPGVPAGSRGSTREMSHGNLQSLPEHFSSGYFCLYSKQTNKQCQCQLSESPKCFLSLLWVCSSPFPWCVGTCEAWFCTDTTLGLEYCGTHKSGYFYILWFWRSNSPTLTNAEFGDLTEIRSKMHLVMLVCISLNVLSYHKPPYCSN